ncbi:MAG TPA: Hsp70 family protein, partial [Pirellulaceae bacterium]
SRVHRDPREDPLAGARLERQVQEAREALSTRHQVTLPIEFEGGRRDVSLSQSQLTLLTSDLLERTSHTTSQLVSSLGFGWKDLDRVLLAGGASRMPAVRSMLHELTGQIPDQSLNPDEAVARGAAIYAAFRLGQTGEVTNRLRVQVANRVAHSLGIEGVDPLTGRREHRILIPRNSPLPACILEPFSLRWEDQATIVVKILEGESIHSEECSVIGMAILDDLPAGLHKGHVVHVVFDVPRHDGLEVRLRVSGLARELTLRLERPDGVPTIARRRWRAVLEGSGRLPTFDDMLRQVLELRPPP